MLLARFEHPALLLCKHHNIRIATTERSRPEGIGGGVGRGNQCGDGRLGDRTRWRLAIVKA